MYNALLVEPNDSVVVVLEPIKTGDKVTYRSGDSEKTVVAINDVPIYHKIAVHDIKNGDPVYKYGEKIGVAFKNIKIGEHAHVHNFDSEREDVK